MRRPIHRRHNPSATRSQPDLPDSRSPQQIHCNCNHLINEHLFHPILTPSPMCISPISPLSLRSFLRSLIFSFRLQPKSPFPSPAQHSSPLVHHHSSNSAYLASSSFALGPWGISLPTADPKNHIANPLPSIAGPPVQSLPRQFKPFRIPPRNYIYKSGRHWRLHLFGFQIPSVISLDSII